MDDALSQIRRAYDRDSEREWARLETGAQNRLELLVTTFALERHLPTPHRPIRVLDAGGGPGRYAIHLAERGYRVTLLDLSPGLLAIARERIAAAGDTVAQNVEAIVEGTFTDLSAFPDKSFDVVICLGGALSHLIDAEHRSRAIAELRRVARPGAPLFVNVLNYLGVFCAAVQWWPDAATIEIFHQLRQGQIVNRGSDNWPAYHYRPEEIVASLSTAGLAVERVYGSEGVGAHLQEEHILGAMADRDFWPAWRDALLATADHPAVIGLSRSLLVVARC